MIPWVMTTYGNRQPHGEGIAYNTDRIGSVARAWNIAIKNHLKDYIVITQDDVIPKKDTADRLVSQLGGDVILTTAYSESDHETLLGMFCFAIDNRFIELVGWFDEGFYPFFYEDTDVLRRIALSGYKAIVADAPVGHSGGVSRRVKSPVVKEYYTQNFVRYCLKWGGAPGKETFDRPFNGMSEAEAIDYFLSHEDPEWVSELE